MALIKYLRKDGNGDYTNLASGIADMLSLGIAANGDIKEYILYVDNGSYSGSFSAEVPFSGYFKIQGSGTFFTPLNIINLSGVSIEQPNFEFSNFIFLSDNYKDIVFNVGSGSALSLSNSYSFGIPNMISAPEAKISLTNIAVTGPGSGIFASGEFINSIGSSYSRFDVSLYSKDIQSKSNAFFHNNKSIVVPNGNLYLSESLIYSGLYGIEMNSGVLSMVKTTIDTTLPLFINSTQFIINDSILNGETVCISGDIAADSILQNSDLYPSGFVNMGIEPSGYNLIYSDPKFNNPNIGDYRLIFKSKNGSECIDHKPLYTSLSGYIDVEPNQLRLYDHNHLYIDPQLTLPFTFKCGSIIIMSDYEREIEFARMIEKTDIRGYDLSYTYKVSKYDIRTNPAFSYLEPAQGGVDLQPWDWDYVQIPTTQIGVDDWWIIGRSFIDLESIVAPELDQLPGVVLFSKLDKTRIQVYNKIEDRGIAYDKYASSQGETIIWILDGRNHLLKKFNAIVNEEIVSYPILQPACSRVYVRPSGIVYSSAQDDKYKFVKVDDTNISIMAKNEYGDIQWIPNHLDQKIDVRGIVAFKDNIFISMSQYSEPVNPDNTRTTGGVGRIVMYNNNDLFSHYTIHPNFNSFDVPILFPTTSDNAYPTDMTIYEDGSLLVLDYVNMEKIYRYKLAYDYAIVENSYDSETRVLLQESYSDVRI